MCCMCVDFSLEHNVSCSRGSHLFQGALGSPQFMDHPERDAQHGGHGQDPAQPVTPPRILILVIVLQRGVLDQGEGKGSLQKQIHLIWGGAFFSNVGGRKFFSEAYSPAFTFAVSLCCCLGLKGAKLSSSCIIDRKSVG